MKRVLLAVGFVGLLFLIYRVISPEASQTRNDEPHSRASNAPTKMSAVPFDASDETRARAENSRTKTHAVPLDPSKGPEIRMPDGVTESGTPDMSGQREAWFSFYRKDFGPTAKELEGKVTIAYPGYEGKFNVQFLIPPRNYEGASSVPIFLADEKEPLINSLGSGPIEEFDDNVLVKFLGGSIRPFFRKKVSDEVEVHPREEPNNITMVLFKFDPKTKIGSTPVEVRFSFQTEGPTTVVGKLDYALREVRRTEL